MLNFNREKVRAEYLDGDPNLPPRYIELLLLRSELLAANENFEKEWNHLNTLNDASDEKTYFEAREKFESRWHILHPSGSHDLRNIPSFYARHLATLEGGDIQEGKVVIEVDLNGPISRVCADVDSLISTWHKEFNRRREEGDFYSDQIHDLKEKEVESRLRGNIKTDFDDYYLYLDVWKLKNDGNSWSEVANKLNFHDIETARNHYKSMKKLIENGVSGLPPFPK